ncbi:MAG: hypothetical protein WD940_01675 [Patescibacteria group bacterium]
MEAFPKTPEVKPATGGKGGGKTCLKILLIAGLILFILFLLAAGAIAFVVAKTGLVEVPVISRLIEFPPPPVDFSFKSVSQAQLEKKLENLESSSGKINFTLTDGEANTLLPELLKQAEGELAVVKELKIKFTENTVHIGGTLVQNDAPFYIALKLAKPLRGPLEFEFLQARLGALSIPPLVVGALIQQLLEAQNLSLDDLPVSSITVSEGKITLTGLDLSAISGGE